MGICIDVAVVPDGTYPPSADGRPRREVNRILENLQHGALRDPAADDRTLAAAGSNDRAVEREPAVTELTAAAAAAEIAAATARAGHALDTLADQASQDAVATLEDVNDDWDVRGRHRADATDDALVRDEAALPDSTEARDAAYSQAWDDVASTTADTASDLAAGDA